MASFLGEKQKLADFLPEPWKISDELELKSWTTALNGTFTSLEMSDECSHCKGILRIVASELGATVELPEQCPKGPDRYINAGQQGSNTVE